jgi:hypothetical protein
MPVAVLLFTALLSGSLQGSATAQVTPSVPNPNKLTVLIKNTLVALNHANLTGNYTVLRDLGAPGFSQANTAARLAAAFTKLRSQRLDLRQLILLQPRIEGKPRIDRRNMLRVNGYFPTNPLRVKFDLVYQPVADRWRLFGIAVNAVPAGTADKPGTASNWKTKTKTDDRAPLPVKRPPQ